MLKVSDLTCGYGPIEILHGISIFVPSGQLVTVIGPNGAGKSTMLHAIGGLLPTYHPTTIRLEGEHITGLAIEAIAQRGLQLVPEMLHLFDSMNVRENMLLGAFRLHDDSVRNARLDAVYTLFPWLYERRTQIARTLSGGERKMLAIGRALMSAPRVLLVDEPSLGLSPRATDNVFAALARLRSEGLTILLAEQNVYAALEVADHVYILDRGVIVADGPPRTLSTLHQLRDYLDPVRA
jgi:branched-chain amino acid transport system ATP-binding protein